MEQKHRDMIDNCCDKIVPRINIMRLFPKLLEHRIYNPDDCNIPAWTENLNTPTTIKDILLKIKTRGPKAFERLLLAFNQIGHEDLAGILVGEIPQRRDSTSSKSVPCFPKEESFVHESFYNDIKSSTEPIKIKLRNATEYLENWDYNIISQYPMRSNPRGLVLLITNIDYKLSDQKDRESAQHDEANLKELFEQMGFRVISKRDLTGKELKDTVKEFSRRIDLNEVDSCFVIISSHGTEDEMHHTEIRGVDSGRTDYEKVLCSDILDYFTVEACPQLAGKPKIFIFQLCRGQREQSAVQHERFVKDTCRVFPKDMDEELKSDNTILSNENSIRNYADMLVIHSTLPGHVAFRDSKTGSWFIQVLCCVFMHLAYRVHVRDLFSIIDLNLQNLRTMDDNCQTSTVKSIGFNRHCYLNPGYFPDQV